MGKHELATACIEVRHLIDWSFKFHDFYEVFIACRYPPLEFLWNLHILQVMPLEIYILNVYSNKLVFQKLKASILKLLTEEFKENDAHYFTQTGLLCYCVSNAFPVACTAENSETIKEVSLEIIKDFLQVIFSTEKDEIQTKRFSCFFSLWNAGILEEKSLLSFCSFVLEFYFNLFPIANDLDSFGAVLGSSSVNAMPYHLLNIIVKLLEMQSNERILQNFTSLVKRSQINAASLLVFVKAFIKAHREASALLSKLASELMNEAFEKFSHETLLQSLLIGYLVSHQSTIPTHIHYRLWLQNIFKECGHSKYQNSFSLLIQVLSDIVPFYKDVECLKVAVESNFPIPPDAQDVYTDYITLLKTRIEDLKPSSKPEEVVEKTLALFDKLGKIPPVVLEMSLLQKHKFLNEFLPALLIPRMVPAVPDLKERFIQALEKAGKIPVSILQKYRDECLKKQKQFIEDAEMIDENFDDFLNEDYI